jgi:hypothetical protein
VREYWSPRGIRTGGFCSIGKNEQANIDDRELAALQKLASALLSMTSAQLERAVTEAELVEITDEEKSNPS